jgi:hypothetical protein
MKLAMSLVAFFAIGASGCADVDRNSHTLFEDVGEVEDALFGHLDLQPSSTLNICWVQDPRVSPQLSASAFLAAHAQHEAYIAEWQEGTSLVFNFQGMCNTSQTSWTEQVRILYDQTYWSEGLDANGNYNANQKIVGPNCTKNSQSSPGAQYNWATFPGNPQPNCLWNFSLDFEADGKGATQHEMGHKLGFNHEQGRMDAECADGTNQSGYFLTPYDKTSVMHYRDAVCAPDGYKEISPLDRLGVEIAYPKAGEAPVSTAAGFHYLGIDGLIREDGKIRLDWWARGALTTVFSNLEWKVRVTSTIFQTVSTDPEIVWEDVRPWARPPTGEDVPQIFADFDDPWGRHRSTRAVLMVSSAKHTAMIMALL